MKYNLKLKKDEEKFAVKHIHDYYSHNSKCKYSNLINSILDDFEKNVIDYNQLKTDNESENIIIKKLLSVFLDKLDAEKENNQSGLFGVRRAFFTDGTNLFYKDLIKDEFVKAKPIYAHDLKELKIKIKSNNGIWLVFDEKKYSKLSIGFIKTSMKTIGKQSKGYSGSGKAKGFPRPIYHSELASEIPESYGRQ